MSDRAPLSDYSSQSGSEYQDSDSFQSEAFGQSPAPSSAGLSTEYSEDDLDDQSTDGASIEINSSRRLVDARVIANGPAIKPRELNSRRRERRLKGWYRPKYRQYFNAAIEEIVNPREESGLPLEASTLGVSYWTAEEKSLLFTNLGVKGRGDSRALSLAVGSKSDSEVQDYLGLLLQGSVEQYLRWGRAEIGYDEIPAAVEVDGESEAALDKAAEKLAYKVEMQDQEREKRRHGDFWLLTPAIAAELEDVVSTNATKKSPTPSDEDQAEADIPPSPVPASLPVPAASLLNLPNWLELASLFMSSSADHTTSWVDLIESNDERPSIYNTAFTDFQTLAISLTKRLVHATIFQAMSRFRATEHRSQDHTIHHHDVQAACRILDQPHNWLDYWVHAPRRIGLEVWTRGQRNERGLVLTHDEVEKALRSGHIDFERSVSSPFPGPSSPSTEPPLDIPSATESDAYDSDFWTSTSASSSSSDLLKTEEARLATLDARASRALAADLAALLQRPRRRKRAPSTSSAPGDARGKRPRHGPQRVIPASPSAEPVKREPESGRDEGTRRGARRDREAHVRDAVRDWREKVLWRPEWISGVVGEEAFESVGRRREEGRRRRAERRRRLEGERVEAGSGGEEVRLEDRGDEEDDDSEEGGIGLEMDDQAGREESVEL